MVFSFEIALPPKHRGIHLVTEEILDQIKMELPEAGLLHLFLLHTSAGLCINESYDPNVRVDVNNFLDKLFPEDFPYVHTEEGPDDMPAHLKSIMTGHSVTIPIVGGKLRLGTWQGIYLCEFRNAAHSRKIAGTVVI